MIQVKCIEKFRDNQGKIIGYRLMDLNEQIQDVESENLKAAIRRKEINVINLTLTSDGRLMNSSEKQLQSKKLGGVPKGVNSELGKALAYMDGVLLDPGQSREDDVEYACQMAGIPYDRNNTNKNYLDRKAAEAYSILLNQDAYNILDVMIGNYEEGVNKIAHLASKDTTNRIKYSIYLIDAFTKNRYNDLYGRIHAVYTTIEPQTQQPTQQSTIKSKKDAYINLATALVYLDNELVDMGDNYSETAEIMCGQAGIKYDRYNEQDVANEKKLVAKAYTILLSRDAHKILNNALDYYLNYPDTFGRNIKLDKERNKSNKTITMMQIICRYTNNKYSDLAEKANKLYTETISFTK